MPYKHILPRTDPKPPCDNCQGGIMMLAFGHSVWGTTDGFITLPKGSTVVFYNEAGETLNVKKALAAMYDTTDMDTPNVIKYEYKSVQNLSLLPAPEHLGI